MKIFRIFSRRQGKTAAADPDGAGDWWSIGDHAECIYRGPWYQGGVVECAAGWGPQFGEVRVVEEISPITIPGSASPVSLGFARYRPNRFSSRAFRKVVPQADTVEAAEEVFTELIRRRPVRTPEKVAIARALAVQVALPVIGIVVAGYAFVLTAWAILPGAGL